jgi:spermidine synthase
MQPRCLLDSVRTADGSTLALWRRGDDFDILIDGAELMSSRSHGSEEELARLALAKLGSRQAPRVLVGGLGMGFTVRAALDALADRPAARVDVVELFPAVVAWNRGELAAVANHPLDDPRVTVVEADVADVIASAKGTYDAILLDVDNGPEALVLDANGRIYMPAGLRHLAAALAPSGVLGIWLSDDDPSFSRRLRQAGFDVTRHAARGHRGRGARHVVFCAVVRLRA